MTREEIIKGLNAVNKECGERFGESFAWMAEIFQEAIKALEQEPCENWYDIPSEEMTLEQARSAVRELREKLGKCMFTPTCEDAISRQAVLDINESHHGQMPNEVNHQIWKEIKALPPVIQENRTDWIPIKTRPLTDEEREIYGDDVDTIYDCKLPDDDEEVFITTKTGHVTTDTFYRDDDYGCYFESYCDDGDVKAWMPKPKGYKGE